MASLFQRIASVPTTQEIEELEEIWRGGIADCGDSRAAVAIRYVAGYRQYRKSLAEAVGATLIMYRSTTLTEVEALQRERCVGAKGFTAVQDVARAWANFAGNMKRKLVVIQAEVPPEAIIMRGKEEEAELVVDALKIDGSTVRII